MSIQTVNPSIRQEPHEVEGRGSLPCVGHGPKKSRIPEKGSVLNVPGDPHYVLIDNATGSYVQMTDI